MVEAPETVSPAAALEMAARAMAASTGEPLRGAAIWRIVPPSRTAAWVRAADSNPARIEPEGMKEEEAVLTQTPPDTSAPRGRRSQAGFSKRRAKLVF
jgi:hypothetical protein